MARQLVTEYPEINTKENMEWAYDFFEKVVNGEKELAMNMYENHSSVNMKDLIGYIEWRANLLLQNLGMTKIFETKTNPMRWITAFDPSNQNTTRTDFHEGRANNYKGTTEERNGFDDL